MNGETHHNLPTGTNQDLPHDLTDSLLLSKAEQEKPEPSFVLQTPQQFRDDFVAAVSRATRQVGLETMQFEVGKDTVPIFDELLKAKYRGVPDVRFHYDRFARVSIKADGKKSFVHNGKALHYRRPIKHAARMREQLIDELEAASVTNPQDKQRGMYLHGSHNHVKLAIVDDVAWFGTMNLREEDFAMSNFMVKVTDPRWVSKLKEVFEQTERHDFGADEVFTIEGQPSTQLLLDSGAKDQSVIYDRATEMIGSLQEGDEFTIISQWPPQKMLFGEMADTFDAAMARGAKGTFLINPAEDLHNVAPQLSPLLQKSIAKKQRTNSNMIAYNLARKTHAKALVIKRASGEVEVLFGSHNFTSRTVKNGTRELAMWSQDPEIVSQITQFLESVQNE